MSFSIKDTTRVKGVAILFLYAYHCFSSEERLGGYPVNFAPFSQTTVMQVSDAMNICVGMFTFLSAYGITLSYKKQSKNFNFSKNQYLKGVLLRCIKLMMNFCFVFVLFFLLHGIIAKQYSYGDTQIEILTNFIIDLSGLTYIFETTRLCGSWWYIGLALFVICLMPFCLELYRKFGVITVALFIFVPVCFITKYSHMTRWLLTIPLGIWFADHSVLERLKKMSFVKGYKCIDRLVKFLIMTLVFIAFVRLRTSDIGSEERIRYVINGVFSAFAVYYIYDFFVDIPILGNVLEFFGKHSLNMFLTHTFIRWIWFKDFTYSLHYAVVIYGFLVMSTILISVLLEGIKKMIHYSDWIQWVQHKALDVCRLTNPVLKGEILPH